ncbi:SLAP domain-containing protein [Sporosarcina sp. FA9]|uniref:SLAP domain-containing protein n=1 Tax=Sporosarcina sp. FA9 TaxID=3413030 RepID=UPI003F659CD4
MKFKIAYHPVWEQTLTVPEKEKYEKLLSNYSSESTSISTSTVVVKQKKNGGMVATVFICNGMNTELKLIKANVKIKNEENTSQANAEFTTNMIIPANAAMPWSFVFKSEDVIGKVVSNEEWIVLISPVD